MPHQGTHPFMAPYAAGEAPALILAGIFVARGERKGSTIPMPTFARRPSTVSTLILEEIAQFFLVGQQRQQVYWNCNSTNFLKPGDYLFWFLGGNAMGQRDGDCRFIGGIEVIAISCGQEFPVF